jgi:hypothetical protein
MTYVYRQVRGALNRIAVIEDRLARIEGFVSDTEIVNIQHQWQLQETINAVAETLFESKKGKMSKTQCFAIGHHDFKHTFRIPVYSMLPESKIEEAINYLAQRYQHFRPGTNLPQIFTDGTQQSLF